VHLKKKILVAPLNWGLGHATRCIPIIEALENHGYEPVIASNGAALELLKKEFPLLTALELPEYHIEYAKRGAFFKFKMLLQIPRMFMTVRRENKIVCNLVREYGLCGIISDNRLGAFCKSAPSVFITHQLNLLTGNTTYLTSRIHTFFVRRYRQCWIPDVAGNRNLSGKIGHTEDEHLNLKYIGPISRLHKRATQKKFDLMVLLSGPEQQRALLEIKLRQELTGYNGRTIFIRGVVEPVEKILQENNITYYNFMNTADLEQAFNESEMVLCRPGYTNVMDLAKLGKRAFFIPTPEDGEQVYLAKKLKRCNMAPFATQKAFKISDLAKTEMYKGLKNIECTIKWKDLFSLFEGE